MWRYVVPDIGTSLYDASPGTIVLVSPHIHWRILTDREGLVQQWAVAASAVAYTEEVGQSVVNALLQIASMDELVPYIPVDLWSWLAKQSSLPPTSLGYYFGAHPRVIKAIQALKDIEIIKSYLLIVWSEWSMCWLNNDKMFTLVQESFGGIEMGHHRGDLIRRLDHVLGQLDRGLEYLKQRDPELDWYDLAMRKNQYKAFRKTLLEINLKGTSRTPHSTITPLCILTPILDRHRVPYNIYVCTPSPMTMVSWLEHSLLSLHSINICFVTPPPRLVVLLNTPLIISTWLSHVPLA